MTFTNDDKEGSMNKQTRTLALDGLTAATYGTPDYQRATALVELAGEMKAVVCARLAARIIRALLPDAVTVVFAEDEDAFGATTIDLRLIRDSADRVLWWGEQHTRHPDLLALDLDQPDSIIEVEEPTRGQIEAMLVEAYDADQGHFRGADSCEYLPALPDENLLVLDMPEALTDPERSELQRLVMAVSGLPASAVAVLDTVMSVLPRSAEELGDDAPAGGYADAVVQELIARHGRVPDDGEVCDECGARIPADEPDEVNDKHTPSCSLHPGAV
jgi:hypothetical protein